MRTIFIAFAAFLTGCAATPPTPTLNATRITYLISSWGYPQERWSIAANGETTFESKPANAQLDTPMQSRTFTLAPADFTQIQVQLAPNERFIANGLACEVAITDAPYGTIQWQRSDGSQQEVRFYTACRNTADLTFFFQHLNAADEAMHALTNMPDHSGRPRP